MTLGGNDDKELWTHLEFKTISTRPRLISSQPVNPCKMQS